MRYRERGQERESRLSAPSNTETQTRRERRPWGRERESGGGERREIQRVGSMREPERVVVSLSIYLRQEEREGGTGERDGISQGESRGERRKKRERGGYLAALGEDVVDELGGR